MTLGRRDTTDEREIGSASSNRWQQHFHQVDLNQTRGDGEKTNQDGLRFNPSPDASVGNFTRFRLGGIYLRLFLYLCVEFFTVNLTTWRNKKTASGFPCGWTANAWILVRRQILCLEKQFSAIVSLQLKTCSIPARGSLVYIKRPAEQPAQLHWLTLTVCASASQIPPAAYSKVPYMSSLPDIYGEYWPLHVCH